MKKQLVITFLSVAAFAVGCKPAPQNSSAEMSVEAATDKVELKTKEAARANDELTQAKKEYAFAQKAEFVTEKQTQLAGINRDLDALSARVETASDASKAEARPRLQALRDQSAKLHTQLDEAKSATESTWDSVKTGSSKAYEDLKNGFQQARQWASEKLAP